MVTTVTTWTTLGAIAMGLGTVPPLWRAVADPRNRRFYAILTGVTGIALVAYLAMTLGIGDVAVGGATVPVPRYVDWLLTTPLLLLYVGLLARASRRRLAELVALDVVVIAAGVAGIAAGGRLTWVAFAVGVLAFAGIAARLWWTLPATAAFPTERVRAAFVKLRNLTVVLWAAYPVAWLFGPPGLNYLHAEATMSVVVYLDVVSKAVFVLVAVGAADALDDLRRATTDPPRAADERDPAVGAD